MTTLALLPNPFAAPVVVAGDMNSAPTNVTVFDPVFQLPAVPPYQILKSAGYVDTWSLRPGLPPSGYTCCLDQDLSIVEAPLFKRIDFVFADSVPAAVKANLVGDDPTERTVSDLWPSDHAGVLARLRFAP